MQVLLELPLGRAVVDQDQLEDVHAIKVDGQLKHGQVEGIQTGFPSFGCRADIIILRHRIGSHILLGPLLLDSFEGLARDSIQKNGRKELSAKFLVPHNMERLLQDV